MSEFIQHLCQLDMFRTSSVHHQERFVQAVFADFVCGKRRTTGRVEQYFVYLVGLHIYYKMMHDPYNTKWIQGYLWLIWKCKFRQHLVKQLLRIQLSVSSNDILFLMRHATVALHLQVRQYHIFPFREGIHVRNTPHIIFVLCCVH